MEIKSYGFDVHICKAVNNSHRFKPSAFVDPLGCVDSAIKETEEKLNESGDITSVKTEIHMSVEEYRYMLEKAKHKGQQEAWDLARRIIACGPDRYTESDFDSVFDSRNATKIFGMPVDEALAKDKKHQEEKKALHVGDEVKFRDTNMPCGYVVDTGMNEFATVLTKDKTTHILRISNLAKTGNFNEDLVKGLAAFDK